MIKLIIIYILSTVHKRLENWDISVSPRELDNGTTGQIVTGNSNTNCFTTQKNNELCDVLSVNSFRYFLLV